MRNFSINDSHENVDELMHHIRQSVASPGHVLDEKLSHLDEKQPMPASSPSSGSANGFMSRNQFDVTDFVKYHGWLFVRNAYLGLLKREPDATGQTAYIQALASGRLNKLDVLAKLRYSAEGRRVGVGVTGLALPATVRKIERIPVLGYVVTWAIAIARLPILHRHLRQSEFYLIEQQSNLARELDRLNEQANQTSNELQINRSHQDELFNSIDGRQAAIEQQVGELTDSIAANHKQLLNQLNEVRAAHASLTKQVAAAAERNSATFKELRSSFDDNLREGLRTQAEAISAQAEAMAHQYKELRSDLASQQKRHKLLQHELSKRASLEVGTWSGGTDDADEQMARPLDELYAAFEDQFRGERDEIKERLKVYLPVTQRAGIASGVLDIGCGRGEWLELLRENNIAAYGIDHNRVFVERCRELGLKVERADTLEHLLKLPAESLSFISAFHVVEHLAFPDLILMLDQIFRALKIGGGIAFETPNPENFMVGSHTFYTDPTHRHPIPSATLKFLVESRGFRDVEIMRLREWDAAKLDESSELVKRFNEYFYCAPDYAVLAWKR